jgi:hypothetical protein
MKYRIPGLASIILGFTAVGIAIYQLFKNSIILGIVYTICFIVFFIITLYYYCRKCPHIKDNSCRRVLFGWATGRLFKPVKPAPYKPHEKLAQYFNMFVYIIFPQYWLFQDKFLFIIFWVLMILSVVIQLIAICPGCKNAFCSYRVKKK